jgi:enoyl-CoA hydratase
MGDLVSYQLTEGVATIVMDDGKVNVLSPAMIAAVNGALDQATSDGAVVILTGRSGIFSGGFDLTTLRAGGPAAALMLEQGFQGSSDLSGDAPVRGSPRNRRRRSTILV